MHVTTVVRRLVWTGLVCACLLAAAALQAWAVSDMADHFALAEQGDVKAVSALLKDKPNLVRAKDGNGATMLHHAAVSGSAELIKLLLNKGADPKATKKDGVTALHVAAALGKVDAVKALLSSGVNVNAKDQKGRTPLSLAQDGGKRQIVDALKKAGAVPSAPVGVDGQIRARYQEMANALHDRRAKDFIAMLASDYYCSSRKYDEGARDYVGTVTTLTRGQIASAITEACSHEFRPHEFYLIISLEPAAGNKKVQVVLQADGNRTYNSTSRMVTHTWTRTGPKAKWLLAAETQRTGYQQMSDEARSCEKRGEKWIRPSRNTATTPTQDMLLKVLASPVAQELRARYVAWAAAFSAGKPMDIVRMTSEQMPDRQKLTKQYMDCLNSHPQPPYKWFEDRAILRIEPSSDGTRADVLLMQSSKYNIACGLNTLQHTWAKDAASGQWLLVDSKHIETDGDTICPKLDWDDYIALGGQLIEASYK